MTDAPVFWNLHNLDLNFQLYYFGTKMPCFKQDGTVPVARGLLKLVNKLGPAASNDS